MDKDELVELLQPKSSLADKATLLLSILIVAMLFVVLYYLAPFEVLFVFGYTTIITAIIIGASVFLQKKDK